MASPCTPSFPQTTAIQWMYKTSRSSFFHLFLGAFCKICISDSCLVPGVLRNRSGYYEPLIFSACMIEILARRLRCGNPSIFASFDADSSDTSPSWSFLSNWKEGPASDCVRLNVKPCFAETVKRRSLWYWNCDSPQQCQLGQARSGICQFSVALAKSTRFEDICPHP